MVFIILDMYIITLFVKANGNFQKEKASLTAAMQRSSPYPGGER